MSTKEELVAQEPRSRKGISGLVLVGCFLVSLALGLLAGNVAVGAVAGLGIGFLAMALTRFLTGEW